MVLDVVKGTVQRAIVYRAGIVSRCHALLSEASLFPSHYTTHMLSSTHAYTVDSAAHTLGSASSHARVRGGQTSSPHAGGNLEVQRPQHC